MKIDEKLLKESSEKTEQKIKQGLFISSATSIEEKTIEEDGEILREIKEINDETRTGVIYYLNSQNKLSRKKGPAFFSFEFKFTFEPEKKQRKKLSIPIREIYYQNGICHGEDGPAYISYHENGKIAEERYYFNGLIHNDNGHAIIQYYPDGKISLMIWYKNGKIHNEIGNAYLAFGKNGKIIEERYYINGKLHREDGPALITYDENTGIKNTILYYNNGKLIKSILRFFGDTYKIKDYISNTITWKKIFDD